MNAARSSGQNPAGAGELPRSLGPALVQALNGLRYGSVELVVHDGRVVQIERREKLRIEDDRTAGDPTPSPHPITHGRPDDRSPRGPYPGEKR